MNQARDTLRPVMRRRRRIFEAARTLFTERGFDAVGIREIAEQAEVSKSLINRHFGSKDRLREAIDAAVIEEFEELLRVVLTPDAGASGEHQAARERAERLSGSLDQILPLLRYLRHSLLENSEGGHAMFRRYLAAAAHSLNSDLPDTSDPATEPRLWLLLGVMFMQLGPIFLEPHIAEVTGRSPFSAGSVAARSRTYIAIDAKLREILPVLIAEESQKRTL